MPEEVKRSYRDDLVQQIKDAGQELIDTAEQMVRKDVRGISGFYIYIEFPQGDRVGIPEITYKSVLWNDDGTCRVERTQTHTTDF